MSLVPVPATTGMVTASMTAANSDSRSSSLSTGASPVVPAMHEPVVAVVLQVPGKHPGGIEVEASVVVERSDHRGEHTSESSHGCNRR